MIQTYLDETVALLRRLDHAAIEQARQIGDGSSRSGVPTRERNRQRRCVECLHDAHARTARCRGQTGAREPNCHRVHRRPTRTDSATDLRDKEPLRSAFIRVIRVIRGRVLTPHLTTDSADSADGLSGGHRGRTGTDELLGGDTPPPQCSARGAATVYTRLLRSSIPACGGRSPVELCRGALSLTLRGCTE